jgi:predicted transcriptional regulator of viral defense system
MVFDRLVELVGGEPVFDTGLLLSGGVDADGVRKQLSRWAKQNKVYQLRRGLYALAPPYQKLTPHPFLVANRLSQASFVSLQSALAYYGMIPEGVPVTTSVTTGRPGRWQTPLGVYEYRHVQVGFFYGFGLISMDARQQVFIASPEKALLDLVYLTPAGDSPDYLAELRLANLDRLDWAELERLASRADKPKLARAVREMRRLAAVTGDFERL